MQTVQQLHLVKEKKQRFVVKANESLQFLFVCEGQREKLERKLVFELEDGATADVKGIILSGEESEVDLTTEMIHKGRDTQGRTSIKGVLTDAAKAKVTGWIRIPKTGHNTDAFLDERFMLLSPKARAKAEPMLEILANDVKASHAATVARIDEEQLFYLSARGITPEAGKRLLTEAFVKELIGCFPEEMQTQCEEKLASLI